MPKIPEPYQRGDVDQESFADYRSRWPPGLAHIPDAVIESWIYRHWSEFQLWLPLRPFEWAYTTVEMSSDEVLRIDDAQGGQQAFDSWGDDLLRLPNPRKHWLGNYMLSQGTTPIPMIVARDAVKWMHPRGHGVRMAEPLQIVEGHLRLAYMRALIHRSHPALQPTHQVIVAVLPIPNTNTREITGQ